MDEETLRRLATQMLDELPEEIPDAERQSLEDSLAEAVARQPGTAKQALLKALRSTPDSRAWVQRHTGLEDDIDRVVGLASSTLAGGVVFVCRKCGYSKMRESVSSTVLFCPNDISILERLS
jgi:hypothetical protein